MTNEFDQARSEIHSQLEDLRTEMQSCHNSFLDATAAYVGQWYEQRVRRILGDNPGHFAALPDETRTQLKGEVSSLIESTGTSVREFFQEADIWWDEKDPSAARGRYDYTLTAGVPPEAIDRPLRLVMGALLPVMEHHGFTATGFALHHADLEDETNERLPYFRQRYCVSNEMASLLDSYATMHTTAVTAEHQLVEVDRDEARNQDQLLWEQA